MVNNLCACCLRSLRNYPGNVVLCTPCKELKDCIEKADQFTLVKLLETYRSDITVEKRNSDNR